jgi:hypothetical protein
MKIIAIFMTFILIFGLVGCDEVNETVSSSSDTESVLNNESVANESIDVENFFPSDMSIRDFVMTVYEIESPIYTSLASDLPKENTKYLELRYGYKPTRTTRRYIEAARLDLKSIVNKSHVGKSAANESHVVMMGDCLVIAIAVFDMEENVAYTVKDSTNSAVMRDDRYYTHTDYEKASGDVQYGQAVKTSFEPDENGYGFKATYGYPVWHFICKEYNSIPEDYVLTLTETLYENDKVVSEEVTLTLTYQDIQELLS